MRNGHGFGPDDWTTEGLPIIRIQNLNGGKNFDFFAGKPDPRWLVEPGQLLFAWAGTKGVSFGPTVWRGPRGVLNQHIFQICPKNDIDPGWLYWALRHVTDKIEGSAHGFKATLVHVKKSDIDRQAVQVPALSEQSRIARILSTWDEALTTSLSILANRREQWHALLAATLHLPTTSLSAESASDNGGYPTSVQSGIPNLPATPEGWLRISLARHLVEVRRPVSLDAEETYRLLTVKRSRGGVELRETLTGLEIKTPSQFYVQADDFLISKRQIVHGACGIVPSELDGAVVSNEYAVLNTDGQIDLRFLRYLSESRYFQQTCFHSSTGVHVEKMIFKTERWLKWPFNIPPLPVQQRIVEVLDTARREVDLIAAQIDRLKQEKSALMADLLSGKRRVRLPVAEATS
jgi:type I restriction enzyme S subunit